MKWGSLTQPDTLLLVCCDAVSGYYDDWFQTLEEFSRYYGGEEKSLPDSVKSFYVGRSRKLADCFAPGAVTLFRQKN